MSTEANSPRRGAEERGSRGELWAASRRAHALLPSRSHISPSLPSVVRCHRLSPWPLPSRRKLWAPLEATSTTLQSTFLQENQQGRGHCGHQPDEPAWRCSRSLSGHSSHPTQKPSALCHRLCLPGKHTGLWEGQTPTPQCRQCRGSRQDTAHLALPRRSQAGQEQRDSEASFRKVFIRKRVRMMGLPRGRSGRWTSRDRERLLRKARVAAENHRTCGKSLSEEPQMSLSWSNAQMKHQAPQVVVALPYQEVLAQPQLLEA